MNKNLQKTFLKLTQDELKKYNFYSTIILSISIILSILGEPTIGILAVSCWLSYILYKVEIIGGAKK